MPGTTFSAARQWTVLVALWLATLVVGLDTMVLSVALSTLSRDLGATNADLQWITDAYTLALAALLIPAGLLADRIGRRRVLVAGLAVFGAASALCALADSPGALIAARLALGLGAAVLISAPLSVVPTVFPVADRGRAMSILVSGMMLGLPLGPILGGWLLEHYWWGSVFLINVPVSLLALAVVALAIPESRGTGAARPDLPGAALAAIGLTTGVYGVIEGPERGWTDPLVLGCLGAGVVLLGGFVLRQSRARRPLVRLSLFRERSFSVGVLVMTLASFALFGVVFVLPQYLQVVLDHDALGAGVRLLPLVAGIIASAPASDRVARRVGRRAPVAGGMLILAGGLAVHSRIGVHSGYGLTAAALLLDGFGIGLALAPAMDAALSVFRADESGTGSSMIQAIRQVGASLSVAVLGSVLNVAYRHRLDPALRDLPPAAARAAHGSVAGAALTADRLGSAGAPLRLAANAAFTHGLSVVLVVCATVAAAGAVAAATLLPNRTVAGTPPPAGGDVPADGPPPAVAGTGVRADNGRHER